MALPTVIFNENDGPIGKIADSSKDHAAMLEYWDLTNTLYEGIRALRAAGETYFPKFPGESTADYNYRLKCSTCTNVYADIIETLSSKPFVKEAHLSETVTNTELLALQENIDGRGNHVHTFIADCFLHGINSAIHWILVEYPRTVTDRVMTIADEKAAGYRPYWAHVFGRDVLETRRTMKGGKETINYARILETTIDGRKSVRVFDCIADGLTAVRIYVHNSDSNEWDLLDQFNLTINFIPIVPFIVGKRRGKTLQIVSPLRSLADMQLELYGMESESKHSRTMTSYSMLAGNGITPDMDEKGNPKPVPLGPNRILYAPMNGDGSHGSWERLNADAASLTLLKDGVKEYIDRMREIGKQPLTAQSGNITRISAAFAANKGNSAVQAWALDLKDAAEIAWKYTCEWIRINEEPEFYIFTDFKPETDEDQTPTHLTTMRKNRDLSQLTYWEEMKNNGILNSNFDPEQEQLRLAEEYPSDTLDDELNLQ